MTAGYSGTPLAKKLGIREDQSVVVIGCPVEYHSFFADEPLRAPVTTQLAPVDNPFIHYFATAREVLRRDLATLKTSLAKKGTLWISWPKKTSRLETDLDGALVRQLGLEAGLVDVKVAAINEDWSGHKFVYRVVDR